MKFVDGEVFFFRRIRFFDKDFYKESLGFTSNFFMREKARDWGGEYIASGEKELKSFLLEYFNFLSVKGKDILLTSNEDYQSSFYLGEFKILEKGVDETFLNNLGVFLKKNGFSIRGVGYHPISIVEGNIGDIRFYH